MTGAILANEPLFICFYILDAHVLYVWENFMIFIYSTKIMSALMNLEYVDYGPVHSRCVINKWYDEWNDEINDENEICWNQNPSHEYEFVTETQENKFGGVKKLTGHSNKEQKDWSSGDEDPVLVMLSEKSRDVCVSSERTEKQLTRGY